MKKQLVYIEFYEAYFNSLSLNDLVCLGITITYVFLIIIILFYFERANRIISEGYGIFHNSDSEYIISKQDYANVWPVAGLY